MRILFSLPITVISFALTNHLCIGRGFAASPVKMTENEQRQERLKSIAHSISPLRGAKLEGFIHKKLIGATQFFEPDIPSFYFYEPKKVLIRYAQGLIEEYGEYSIRDDRFCVYSAKRRWGCSRLYIRKVGLLILNININNKERYVIVTARR